jgi:hypothetical protein
MDGFLWHIIFFQMFVASDAFQDSCTGWSRDLPWEGSNSEPTPVPPTLAEAIAALVNATANNTRFLREMAGSTITTTRRASISARTPRNIVFGFLRDTSPIVCQGGRSFGRDEWIRIIEQKFELL